MNLPRTIFTSLAGFVFVLPSCIPNPRVSITKSNDLPSYKSLSIKHSYPNSINVSQLRNYIYASHPRIQSAKLKLEEAEGLIDQAGRYANPTLTVGTSKSLLEPDFSLGTTFSQVFPVTNRLGIEKRVSKEAYKMAEQEIKIVTNSIVKEAQLHAADYFSVSSKKTQIKKEISTLETLANFIESAAARGELSALDAGQTRLEITTLEAKLKALNSESEIALSTFKTSLGIPASQKINLVGKLKSPQLPSVSINLPNLPQVKLKQWEAAQAKSNVLLQKANRFEDVEMSISGELGAETDEPEGREAETAIGFQFSIPLPLYDKNEGNIKTATAFSKRVLLEKQTLESDIRSQASTQKLMMKTWLAQNNTLTSTILPAAKKNSKQLENAYRSGQGSFTDFLKSKLHELNLETQIVENTNAFHKARIIYLATIGQSQQAF